MIIKNNDSYGLYGNNMGDLAGTPNSQPRHTMTVEFILDGVPGAWFQPEDLMNWICTNPYVTQVTTDDPDLQSGIKDCLEYMGVYHDIIAINNMAKDDPNRYYAIESAARRAQKNIDRSAKVLEMLKQNSAG